MLAAATLLVSGCTSAAGGSALGGLQESAQVSRAGADAPGTDASAPNPPTTAAPPTTSSSTPPPPPPPDAVITATPANGATGIDPLAPISVTVAHGTLTSVQLTNAAGEQVPGTLAPDGLSWTTTPELGYGQTYTLAAAAANSAGVPAQSATTFTTVVPDNYTAARVFPSDGMTVGVAQPVSIHFDELIADKAAAAAAVKVTTSPEQPGGFRWIDDKELRWRPMNWWQPGTTVQVTVDIYGKHMGGGLYGQHDSGGAFTVGRSLIAEIDDNTKQMVVTVDGQVVRTIPVSMGSGQWPTYNGVHVVAEKYDVKIMDSTTWGLTGAGAYRTAVSWATRISSTGEFVHAAPWSVWAQGSENVSHGCVNISTEAAKWFYDTALPGDPVTIRNTVGPPLEVWDGYGDWQLPFEQYVAA
jgi:lipoprotein-anchoring transpeptidase ErfK/SrfK